MVSKTPDIHKFAEIYQRKIKAVENSLELSETNKRLILAFDRQAHLEGLSVPRKSTIISLLNVLATRYLPKDFFDVTMKDLQNAVIKIDQSDYSQWSKHGYKSLIKKFYSWVEYGDEYRTKVRLRGFPERVSWLSTTISKKDRPRVQASNLLTEEEVRKLIDSAQHPRDKAFVSLLYELGARIGEIGNLTVGSISKDKYGYLVELKGKTGTRTPIAIMSAPHLTTWLNAHPDKGNPDAPLWVQKSGNHQHKKMMYGALRMFVRRLVKRAGIRKRVYPHLFRHTRVTHLQNNQISDSQAKVFFGWNPASQMLAEYSHLVSRDANNAILDMYGIQRKDEQNSKLSPRQCPMCGEINGSSALFCQKCAQVLDVKTAISMDEKRREYDEMINLFLKDPAAREYFSRKAMEMKLLQRANQESS